MIKIIKKGRDVKEFKCEICDTIFSYEEEDLVKIQPSVFTRLTYLKCPNCKHTYGWAERNYSNLWEKDWWRI